MSEKVYAIHLTKDEISMLAISTRNHSDALTKECKEKYPEKEIEGFVLNCVAQLDKLEAYFDKKHKDILWELEQERKRPK